eukprot:TRINITY_DN6444_c0_g3_i3.p1 TRINITY_DN6444_c0_g3~~TRINITY_DN6444_c0_g3_i3.p1  ORF type:complete len:479 (+),score=45.48 TRINITY_DN6444_c0_g3_i3:113-1549(+)
MENDNQHSTTPKQSLSAIQLVGLLFVATIGGAYGIEEGVQTGGGLGLTLGVLIAPWVWGLPTAMIISELATSLPSNAGPVLWISKVAPTFVTFCFVVFTTIANVVDNSIYPNLLVSYFTAPSSNGVSSASLPPIFIKIISISAAAILNIISIDAVGVFGTGFMFLTIGPFILMFLMRVGFMGDLSSLLRNHVPEQISWGKFIPILTWNVAGIDSVGNIVEEIKEPQRVLFPSLVTVIVLSQVTYVLPVVAALTIPGNTPQSWVNGSWVGFAEDVGGEYLRIYMQFAGMLSSFGFLTTLLCTTSRALQGIAAMGFAPMFQHLGSLHPTYRTPANAIITNALITLVVSSATDFVFLVEVGQLLYMTRLLAVFLSALLIRMKYPSLHRPFSVPGRLTGILLAVGLPTIYSLFSMLVTLQNNPLVASMFALLSVMTVFLSLSVGWTVGFKNIDLLAAVSVPSPTQSPLDVLKGSPKRDCDLK